MFQTRASCTKRVYETQGISCAAQVTGHGHLYSGVTDCLRKTVAAEGLRGLYKGWLANWLRIGCACFAALWLMLPCAADAQP